MLYVQVVLLLLFITLCANLLFALIRKKNWLKLGKHAIAKKDFDLAVHYLSNEIRENPENTLAFLERAKAYSLQGDLVKSKKDKKKAYEMDPYLLFQLTIAAQSDRWHSNQKSSYAY